MTENNKPRFKRGCLGQVIDYMRQRPSKLVTIEELEKALAPDWDRRQIMGAITKSSWGRNANHNPLAQNIEKLSTGVWRYVDGSGAEVNKVTPDRNGEPQQPEGDYKPIISEDMMLVEVLKEKANYILVEDTNDGKIYKMVLVG